MFGVKKQSGMGKMNICFILKKEKSKTTIKIKKGMWKLDKTKLKDSINKKVDSNAITIIMS